MTLDDILAEMELETVRLFPSAWINGREKAYAEGYYRGAEHMRVFARKMLKEYQREMKEYLQAVAKELANA